MEHRAELLVHAYLSDVRKGKAGMSDDTIKGIVKHVEAAVRRQFQTKNTRDFKLRASNIGRSLCQLWFQKNKPEAATPPASHFLMRMMIGDITEAVFKGLLKEAGAKFEEPEKVETEIERLFLIKRVILGHCLRSLCPEQMAAIMTLKREPYHDAAVLHVANHGRGLHGLIAAAVVFARFAAAAVDFLAAGCSDPGHK